MSSETSLSNDGLPSVDDLVKKARGLTKDPQAIQRAEALASSYKMLINGESMLLPPSAGEGKNVATDRLAFTEGRHAIWVALHAHVASIEWKESGKNDPNQGEQVSSALHQ
jgi:hypothetical protein